MRTSLLTGIVLFVCVSVFSQEPSPARPARPSINLADVPESAFEKGKITLKLSRKLENLLDGHPLSTGASPTFDIPLLDSLNRKFKVSAYHRTFGTVLSNHKFSDRHHAFGLHLWYQLEFPSTENVKQVAAAYAALQNLVEVSEPVYKKQLYGAVPPRAGPPSANFLPNDLRFTEQWQYKNTGQQDGITGSDIRMEPAWNIETGNPDVVVAVVDQGVQVNHPDLAANIWPGNGFNFAGNSNSIDAGEHGTHTAGTVAAVNNNGTGVSGVAGGDGSPNSGVKLMSLEVFGPSGSTSNFGDAFIWAADHGAAITQNSWGYLQPNVFEQSVMDGIDYFIAFGGGSVLKGGLVIFSAGNNGNDANYYPGYYYKVMCVAATNNRDVRSYYSNYGSYIDICAPGGEQSFPNDPHGILSTTNHGSYVFLQGTSMACPHVSGVAALVIALAPGRFSNDDVKSILLSTTDDVYPNNQPEMAGKLGSGRLNAFKAIQLAQELAAVPLVEPVKDFNAVIDCENVALSWTSNDANDSVVIAYSPDGGFGLPSGRYAPGDQISTGGTVIYTGPATSVNHHILKDSADVAYKIWSFNPAYVYSAGLVKFVKTPFTIKGFSASPSGNSILLNWDKGCPNSDVLIAVNSVNVFGTPSGALLSGNSMAGGGTVIYRGSATAFQHLTPFPGINYYRIWPVIDSAYSIYFKSVVICHNSQQGPVAESFEDTLFPPAGWSIANPNGGSTTWERTMLTAHSGIASARMNFFNYPTKGDVDYLYTPSVGIADADSVFISFERAYRVFDPTLADSLEVLISTDCGNTFRTVWKKGGDNLVSVPGTFTGDYIPLSQDWVKESLNVKPYLGNATNLLVAFKSVNAFGQNLYLDDINIFTTRLPQRDVAISSITDPFYRLCIHDFTPEVKIQNRGRDTLTTAVLLYQLDNGPADSVTWSGKLAYSHFVTVPLKDMHLRAGAHRLSVIVRYPNGIPDANTANDSALRDFSIFDAQPGPILQGFEGSLFPPANWSAVTAGNAYSWERTQLGASERTSSIWIRNSRFNGNGSHDDLYSPLISAGVFDSVYLDFDVAHAAKPAALGTPVDTLQAFLSTDCGNTLHRLYVKWGADLNTIPPDAIPTFPAGDTVGFIPSRKQWRTERLDLTPYVGINKNFEVIFRSSSNRGSNIFLDNINISAVTLPDRLKKNGYMVLPNPFNTSFIVRHLATPTDLQAIVVLDAAGRTLQSIRFNQDASGYVIVDMSRYTNGIYLVKLVYSNRVITEKMIKQR